MRILCSIAELKAKIVPEALDLRFVSSKYQQSLTKCSLAQESNKKGIILIHTLASFFSYFRYVMNQMLVSSLALDALSLFFALQSFNLCPFANMSSSEPPWFFPNKRFFFLRLTFILLFILENVLHYKLLLTNRVEV